MPLYFKILQCRRVRCVVVCGRHCYRIKFLELSSVSRLSPLVWFATELHSTLMDLDNASLKCPAVLGHFLVSVYLVLAGTILQAGCVLSNGSLATFVHLRILAVRVLCDHLFVRCPLGVCLSVHSSSSSQLACSWVYLSTYVFGNHFLSPDDVTISISLPCLTATSGAALVQLWQSVLPSGNEAAGSLHSKQPTVRHLCMTCISVVLELPTFLWQSDSWGAHVLQK